MRRSTAAALTAIALLTAFLSFGCRGCRKPAEDDVLVLIPESSYAPARATVPEPTDNDEKKTEEPTLVPETETPAPTETPTPTPLPTATPAAVAAEETIRSGGVYALNGGKPVGKDYAGEYIDIDGDGTKDALEVKKVEGAYTFCINGEPFLDAGACIRLASPDGRRTMFITDRKVAEGYNIFYPDSEGNLFCRLFAVSRSGTAADYSPSGSIEEGIREGLDVIMQNPAIYSTSYGADRAIRIDMDGDGVKDDVLFDNSTVTINGQEDTKLLSTTMPRFIYDAEKNTIVLYGSAGDFAVMLWLENGELQSAIKYADLL